MKIWKKQLYSEAARKSQAKSNGTQLEYDQIFKSSALMQGWFHGLQLKGEIEGRGTEVKLLDFNPPAPGSLQATVVFTENEAVSRALGDLSKTRKRISRLSLVVRNNPKSAKPDTEYRMSSTHVLKVRQRMELQGTVRMAVVEVTLAFERLTVIAGLSQNPGPPPRAPEITQMGPNKGWLYGVLPYEAPSGIPINIFGFSEPDYNGELKIVFSGNEDLCSRLVGLEKSKKPLRELILVLPDMERCRYVEYKLFNVLVDKAPPKAVKRGTKKEVASEIVFSSSWIECLTGNDEKNN